MIFRLKAKTIRINKAKGEAERMSNSYDNQYEFRVATKEDIDSIMQFIGDYWKADHILSYSKPLFEYEFLEEDGTVNFILAIDRRKGTIECLNGFLKASHDENNLDIWGSIWKVLDGNKGMLGVELIRRRKEMVQCRCDLDVGDNPETAIPIFKSLLKRYTIKMSHYYMLSERECYKIAKILYFPEKKKGKESYNVIRFNNINEVKTRYNAEKFKNRIPYKDYWYINHRFFEHPVYNYEVYGIEFNKTIEALFVLRNQPYENSVAVRFVDYIGECTLIRGIGWFLEEYLKKNDRYEYIDFYCAGMDDKYIREAGFSALTDNDMNIIPNYFEPFRQENIDIWVDSSEKDSLFTKADADQDRPNRI